MSPQCGRARLSSYNPSNCNCNFTRIERRLYLRQCAAVKTHLLLMSDPPHRKYPLSLSMTCHGQSPRAAHWPLMTYGLTFIMFGERRPHTASNMRCLFTNSRGRGNRRKTYKTTNVILKEKHKIILIDIQRKYYVDKVRYTELHQVMHVTSLVYFSCFVVYVGTIRTPFNCNFSSFFPLVVW